MINLSLSSGKFPESWKESLVIPIPKVEKTERIDEFRPVNMLPLYEELLERVAHKQLEEHFTTQTFIMENQSLV